MANDYLEDPEANPLQAGFATNNPDYLGIENIQMRMGWMMGMLWTARVMSEKHCADLLALTP